MAGGQQVSLYCDSSKAGSHAYGTALPWCRLHEEGLRWPGNGAAGLEALRRLTGG